MIYLSFLWVIIKLSLLLSTMLVQTHSPEDKKTKISNVVIDGISIHTHEYTP